MTTPPTVPGRAINATNRPMSRRRLITGGVGAAGAAGAAAILPAGRLVATSHLPPAGQLVTLREPVRVFDSRQPDSLLGGAKLTTPQIVAVTIGVDADDLLMAVFVNLTITETEGAGFLTARAFYTGDDESDGGPPPVTTSNANWTVDGVTLANMALVPIGAENSIELICSGVGAATHVIVDVQGFVPFVFDDG